MQQVRLQQQDVDDGWTSPNFCGPDSVLDCISVPERDLQDLHRNGFRRLTLLNTWYGSLRPLFPPEENISMVPTVTDGSQRFLGTVLGSSVISTTVLGDEQPINTAVRFQLHHRTQSETSSFMFPPAQSETSSFCFHLRSETSSFCFHLLRVRPHPLCFHLLRGSAGTVYDPVCAFWDFSLMPESGGWWNTKGCEVVSKHYSSTVCFCNHTTNFALLLQVYEVQILTGQVLTGQVLTGQVLTGQVLPGQVLTGQVLPGQVLPGQILTGQVLTGQVLTGQVITGQILTGQVLTGQELTGQVLTGQVLTGQVLTGQILTGQVITGQILTGQVLTGQELTGQVLTRQWSPENQRALEVLTFIGCGVSLCGLLFTLVLFLAVGVPKSDRTTVHKNLIVALALAQMLLMCSEKASANEVVCFLVTALLHLFYMASFCWMLVEGLLLWSKVVSVNISEDRRMKVYYVIGWGEVMWLAVIGWGEVMWLAVIGWGEVMWFAVIGWGEVMWLAVIGWGEVMWLAVIGCGEVMWLAVIGWGEVMWLAVIGWGEVM
uniref:Uncharacterized protein n=1 Tax=Knipowitschia caucasica TaxID=637954 RepID=A0AAV2MVD1_KNICA